MARTLLDEHDTIVRQELARFGGTEIDTTGDGFLITFDGPGRAIRCASAIRDALAPYRTRDPGRRTHRRGGGAGRADRRAQTGVSTGNITNKGFDARIGSNTDSFADVFGQGSDGHYYVKKADSPRVGVLPVAKDLPMATGRSPAVPR